MTSIRLLIAASHPGPSVAVTVLAVILGAAVGLPPSRTVLLGVVVLVGQLSIGWSNDWLDAQRDRVTARADKPLVRGGIGVRTVRAAALLALLASVPLSLSLGPASAAAHLLFIGCGWLYNAWLKSTVVSVLPFIVGFGALPAVVTLTAQPPLAPAAWAVVVGAMFGVAIHFTNALPDLEDDLRTGVRGLPHRLGARGAGLTAFTALGGAAIVVLLGQSGVFTANTVAPPVVGVVGAVVVVLLALGGAVLVSIRRPDRLLFRLIIAAAVVLVAELAFAGTALVAISTS